MEGFEQKLVLPQNSYVEPYIIEERQRNVTQLSVYSRLMMDRILFLGTEINPDIANILVSQLLFLDTTDDKPITMYINSPGGSVYDGMAIYDTMNFIKSPVHTMGLGMAASMASVLLSSGEKGKRSSLPHTKIMVHAPRKHFGDLTAPDAEIEFKEMQRCKDMLYEVLAENSGQSKESVEKMCERDHWMFAAEAKEEGLIDKVIGQK